ncbi:MAG: hypothetical protein MUC94_00065 [bacterium]|nr:hypothetical protein [bacterium]
MKTRQHNHIISLIILLYIILISCNRSSYRLPVFRTHNDSPVGVDSLIIADSDSVIKFLFVDFASERKASDLAREAQTELSLADSVWQLIKTDSDSTKRFIISTTDTIAKSQVEYNIAVKKIISGLEIAERRFQQSIKLNPFLLSSKDGLAQTYILWAQIEKPLFYFEKAAAVLAKLVQNEKSEHILCYRLGECYFQLGKWEQAFSNYHQAEKIFIGTKAFSNGGLFENKPEDYHKNDLLFNYLYSQAVCLARMYKSPEALIIINQARDMAPNDSLRNIAERFEDWINWDKGNIYTAEQKNQILKLINEKNYQDASIKFDSLKNQLSDPLAIVEIEWRIAGLEFRYLNKKEQACERLLTIIEKSHNFSNHPNHSIIDFSTYLNDCGVMHYHLGMEFIEKTDYKQAQKYLEQGAKIDWYGNYKCQLELAKLNRHDPQISLSLIEKVLTTESALTEVEKLTALEIKLGALKKLGPQHRIEAKHVYNQIRELQNK